MPHSQDKPVELLAVRVMSSLLAVLMPGQALGCANIALSHSQALSELLCALLCPSCLSPLPTDSSQLISALPLLLLLVHLA